MNQIQSVSAQEAFTRARNGIALLVCAYESDDKFKHVHLEGAIALSELRRQQGAMSRDRELIFYCA